MFSIKDAARIYRRACGFAEYVRIGDPLERMDAYARNNFPAFCYWSARMNFFPTLHFADPVWAKQTQRIVVDQVAGYIVSNFMGELEPLYDALKAVRDLIDNGYEIVSHQLERGIQEDIYNAIRSIGTIWEDDIYGRKGKF
jgi:hypothetical protein